jgi:hypothetical protein
MDFNFNTEYGGFVRPDFGYPDFDYNFDPNLYNFGLKYEGNVAAIWVGSDPLSYAYIELAGDTALSVGHSLGPLSNFSVNAATSVYSGELSSNGGVHILSSKKNFDIPHPSKEGYRLRHTCLEGPKNDVYIRGRVRNSFEIYLPTYWKNFVDIATLTVNLTPLGAPQEIFVKRIEADKIVLQSKGNIAIDAFYTIYAERIDGEKLIPEYEGTTPEDYPGSNDEYSISGYHYDTK